MAKRQVRIKNVLLGGDKISVQSMTTVKTSDVEKCVAQIISLQEAGCDIVRVSVLDEADARAIRTIKERTSAPIVADVHFSDRKSVV